MTKKSFEKELFISLTDIGKALKNAKRKILVCFIVFAVLAGYYQLRRPLSYTSYATFKVAQGSENNNLSKFFLTDSPDFNQHNRLDPKSLFHSRSLSEKVVKKLGLQAALSDGEEPSFFKNIWHNVKAEYYYYKYQKWKRPFSPVLSSKVIIPQELLFKDKISSLSCVDVNYPQETFCVLQIRFKDENTFQVYEDEKILGEGQLGEPFFWAKGNFTLSNEKGKKLTKKNILLSLMPAKDVGKGLMQTISLKKDKEDSSLLVLSYTHSDRHLAANVINALMDGYRDFLKEEATKRTDLQIAYLEKRHEYSRKKLEELIQTQSKSLEENLDAGGLILTTNEIELLTQMQSRIKENLHSLSEEIHLIYEMLAQEKIAPATHPANTLMDIFHHIGNLKSEKPLFHQKEGLTIGTAREIQKKYSLKLSSLKLETKQYESIISHLEDPHFEISSLGKILDDPTSKELLSQLSNLSLQLLDEKNRMQKEQERLKSDFAYKKKFLKSHLEKLTEVLINQTELIKHKLRDVQESLLVLLYEAYLADQNELVELQKKVSSLPQKWLFEKKLQFDTEIYSKIIQSLAELIESKNVSLNTDYLNSYPLDNAIPASLPNSPKILLKMFLIGLSSVFVFANFLVFKAIFAGVSCSKRNIEELGHPFLGNLNSNPSSLLEMKGDDLETIRNAAHFIHQNESKKVFLNVPENYSIAFLLAQILGHYDRKKTLIIRVEEFSSVHSIFNWDITFSQNGACSNIPSFPFRQEYFLTNEFKSKLAELSLEWELIIFECHSQSQDASILLSHVDSIIHIATQEAYSSLQHLTSSGKQIAFIQKIVPSEKEFVKTADFLKKQKSEVLLQLKHIEPFLDALKKRLEKSLASLKKT